MTGVEIAVVLGASLVGAFVKAVTGMGYPLIAVPLISLVLGVDDAVVLVAAPNITANALLCWEARDARHEVRDLPALLVSSVLGAVVGTALLVSLPEEPILLALVATIVAFVVSYLRTPELRLAEATTHRWAPVAGGLAGVMQGAVGVSGPVVAMWLHGYRLRARAYVHAATAIFGVSGTIQLALLVGAGELTRERAAVSALAFVPVLAMLPVGSRLRDRLGGRGFELAVVGVLVASGAALVVRVLG